MIATGKKRKYEGIDGAATAEDGEGYANLEEEGGAGGKENLAVHAGSGGGGNGLASGTAARKANGVSGPKRNTSSLEFMESLSMEDLEKSMRENRNSMLNLVVKEGYKDSNDLVVDDYDQEEEHDISKAGITKR